jgi:hypothetical protein
VLISFGLQSDYRIALHEEIFNLCYYGNGGFTQSEVYALPVHQRRFYLRKLMAVKEGEAKQNEAASKQNSNSPSIVRGPGRK